MEGMMHPSSGEWTWDDNTQSLKFSSNSPVEKQDRKKRGKGLLHALDRRTDRATPSIASRPYAVGRGRPTGTAKSPKPGQKHQHTHVTLDDIKGVSLDKLSEQLQTEQIVTERGGDDSISPHFITIYGTEQFDHFLLHLFYYFHCFFEKKALDEKPNPMNIEPSVTEIKEYEAMCVTLQLAQKYLGRAYCVLILGLGLQNVHHMSCGMSRVSATDPDKVMYENLYNFCTLAAWITFKRKYYDVIQKEVGRMLRSDTFNPALRVKYAPELDGDEDLIKSDRDDDAKKDRPKLTLAEIRKINQKRPAIKSIIHQRSPAIVSILPTSKEQAEWLFRRQRAFSPTTLGTYGKENDEDGDEQLELDFEKIKEALRLGILGLALTHFNPTTLTPVGGENDDQGEDGHDEEQQEDGSGDNTPQDGNQSRMGTAMSSATTEALSDDE